MLSIGDFNTFKDIMLTHRVEKQEEKCGEKLELEVVGKKL
jgi:hypothetical protein